MKHLEITERDRLFLTEDLDWLGVDLRGLALEGIARLWLWVEKPAPVGVPSVYAHLPSDPPRGGQYTGQSSKRITASSEWFPVQDEFDGHMEQGRVWICVDVPHNLTGTNFVLIPTSQLNVPGWGK